MNKIWIIFKTEFINTISRRSFILTLVLVPLVPALILGGMSLFGSDEGDAASSEATQAPVQALPADGYVDLAGIISEIPAWIGEDQWIAYESETSARNAVLAGEIQGFYVIDPDYIENGAIRYCREDFSPLSALEASDSIEAIIRYNLLGADPQRFEAYANPLQVEQVDLTPEEVERDNSNPLAFYVPYGVTILFYFLTYTSASLMLNSIAKEKENRVMEILMNAVTPRQLLTGKILALGLVGLLQLVVWLGSALILLRLGGTTLNIPPDLQLPPTLLVWGSLFFIAGYLIYATIMAGVGALVPNLKEASQATTMIIIPILIPLFLISSIIETPHATLPVVLSLIPFTASTTIMTRMAVTTVPLWQILTSLGLMALTFVLLIRSVARMFQTQLLLTGQKFSIRLYLQYLLGKNPGAIPEQNG